MSRILIPRSDSISAKIIEPSDFEKYFSSDIVKDYRKTGMIITAGAGLSVNISTGIVSYCYRFWCYNGIIFRIDY